MKKILAMLLALVMVLSLAACASTQPAAEPAASSDAPAESGKTYTVGVCQLVQHEALDAATQGFCDALTEALGAAGRKSLENISFAAPLPPPKRA